MRTILRSGAAPIARWSAKYGRLEVANLYALRSTDPAARWQHADPAGRDNDDPLYRVGAGAWNRGMSAGRQCARRSHCRSRHPTARLRRDAYLPRTSGVEAGSTAIRRLLNSGRR
ncbi:DUF1643 domain-containing protein [Caballeronia glathei]|uniref:DUF1643 domain-containing protein n=1 Tax=Caballeronia glathei TaxID=60547 RepID=UPI00398AA3D0